MKRKLRIEELSVASFSTDEDGVTRERGTVRGFIADPNPIPTDGTCAAFRTCDVSCQGIVRTCYATCDDPTCNPTCVAILCG